MEIADSHQWMRRGGHGVYFSNCSCDCDDPDAEQFYPNSTSFSSTISFWPTLAIS